eukprot:Amastigsp_a4588_90.p5 type:complete len:100 gc:universal Amastigsp_a4588_90:138-437(+)
MPMSTEGTPSWSAFSSGWKSSRPKAPRLRKQWLQRRRRQKSCCDSTIPGPQRCGPRSAITTRAGFSKTRLALLRTFRAFAHAKQIAKTKHASGSLQFSR